MFPQTTFYTEFLSESNLVLTQEDHGGRLSALLSPLKNYLQNKEKEVLSFSLARYCGANSRLAFFCEWYYQGVKLSLDNADLEEEVRKYLKKKVPVSLRGVPNLDDIIEKDIKEFFLPQQLIFVQAKGEEMQQDIVKKYDYLSKYLNSNFLNQIVASEVLNRNYLYSENVNLTQFLEAQSMRLSFVLIGLPCLIGFLYNFSQEESPISLKGVKWVMVESILKNIAILHQTSLTRDLNMFIYQNNLGDKEKFKWLQLSDNEKIVRAMSDEETRKQFKESRDKVYKRSLNDLENLVFPEKYREMFKDLIDWTYALGRGV